MRNEQKKPLWHEAENDDIQSLLLEERLQVVLKRFAQPTWCDHPNALDTTFGCKVLVSNKTKKFISELFCQSCDMCHFYHKYEQNKNNSNSNG